MSEKLRIIQFAEQTGNCAAEWEFGVLECLVRLWWKSKENLENMPWLKQANHGKKAAWLELEMNMLAWITFCCENFFFWKIWLKTRVCVIHRRILYTGKYCKQALLTNSTFFSCQMEKMDLWNVLFKRCLPHSQIWECKCLRYSFTGGIYWRNT